MIIYSPYLLALVYEGFFSYKIFIAGPGDVDKEALEAVHIIELLDRVLCPRLHIHIQSVRGSIDAPAGVGRPQSRINPLVADCDFFVGIFSRRIGSPTGTADSGTIEEFMIADTKARLLDSPEIKLFFKELRQQDKEDPGPQLAKGRIPIFSVT